jgi:hypothetical protein
LGADEELPQRLKCALPPSMLSIRLFPFAFSLSPETLGAASPISALTRAQRIYREEQERR